jgi:ribosome-associated toxin RatA of RatAB toxin-antitoxin module
MAETWSAVKDIEAYPRFMENVRSVEVVSDSDGTRVSKWSTLLKGSILEWTEAETMDDAAGRIEFHQLDGDLDVFAGYWQVTPDPGGVLVELSVDFEIGIPLLADMLNPVAARALKQNSESMLREIELILAAG